MGAKKARAIAPWAQEEMATVQLNDKRLDQRLTELLSALGDPPAASIPAGCGGYAEMKAAYRFFDNPKVTFAKILEPHFAATRQRLAAQPVALLVQDTTEGDVTGPQQQVAGTGPLDGGKRRGVFVHPLVAFTPDGTPLGTVSMQTWTRPAGPAERASPAGPAHRGERELSLGPGAAGGARRGPGVAPDPGRLYRRQRRGPVRAVRRTPR